MRKLNLRLLSALLAVLMLLSTMSTVVFADQQSGSLTDLKTDEARVLVTEDFTGFTVDDTIDYDADKTTEVKAAGSSSNTMVDESGKFFAAITPSATILADPDGGTRGNVAKLAANNGAQTFGISEHAIETASGATVPTKLKLEFDLRKAASAGEFVMVRYGHNANNGRLMHIHGNGSIIFYNAGTKLTTLEGAMTPGEWVKYTIYLDTEAKKCVLYMDGVYTNEWSVSALNVPGPGLTFAAYSSTDYIDNIRICEYEDFELESTSIANGATGVATDLQTITATFNQNVGTVTNALVTVTGGTSTPSYTVSASGKVLTVTLPNGLEPNTEYTVTIDGEIANSEGMKLGTDKQVTFTTKMDNEVKVLASEDFNSLSGTIDYNEAKTAEVKAAGCTNYTKVDSTGKFFAAATPSVTIVDDPDGTRGKVAKLANGNGAQLFGISEYALKSASGGTIPTKLKLEFDYRAYGSLSIIRYGYNDGNGQLMRINGTSVLFYNAGTKLHTIENALAKNTWVKYTIYLDTEAKKCVLYMDGEYKYAWEMPNWLSSRPDFTFATYVDGGDYIDNIRVCEYEDFELESTSVANGAIGVDPELKTITATFNQSLGSIDGLVTVSATTGTVPSYNVTKNGKVVTITFAEGLGFGKTYTVTFSKEISSLNGFNLGDEDATITFKTISQYEPSGFTSTIADFDFDDGDLAAGDTIVGISGNTRDETSTYFITRSGTVNIAEGGDGYGLSASIPGSGSITQFGVFNVHYKKSPAYTGNDNKFPALTKFEVEIKKTSSSRAYLYLGSGSNNVVRILENGSITILGTGTAANDTSVGTAVVAPNDQWNKVTVYIDYSAKEYVVYINDAFVWRQTGVTSVNFTEQGNYAVGCIDYVNSANYPPILVDNISVSTLPAYESPIICEYRDLAGVEKMAFVAKNVTAAEKTYKIICAEYNSDNVLVSTTITNGTVAASTNELEILGYPTPASGNYCKYFIWDSFATMLPMVQAKEIR